MCIVIKKRNYLNNIPSCLGVPTKGWISESQHWMHPYFEDPQAAYRQGQHILSQSVAMKVD